MTAPRSIDYVAREHRIWGAPPENWELHIGNRSEFTWVRAFAYRRPDGYMAAARIIEFSDEPGALWLIRDAHYVRSNVSAGPFYDLITAVYAWNFLHGPKR